MRRGEVGRNCQYYSDSRFSKILYIIHCCQGALGYSGIFQVIDYQFRCVPLRARPLANSALPSFPVPSLAPTVVSNQAMGARVGTGTIVPGTIYCNSQVAAQHQAAFEYALVAQYTKRSAKTPLKAGRLDAVQPSAKGYVARDRLDPIRRNSYI